MSRADASVVMDIDVGSEDVKMYWGGVYWMFIIAAFSCEDKGEHRLRKRRCTRNFIPLFPRTARKAKGFWRERKQGALPWHDGCCGATIKKPDPFEPGDGIDVMMFIISSSIGTAEMPNGAVQLGIFSK